MSSRAWVGSVQEKFHNRSQLFLNIWIISYNYACLCVWPAVWLWGMKVYFNEYFLSVWLRRKVGPPWTRLSLDLSKLKWWISFCGYWSLVVLVHSSTALTYRLVPSRHQIFCSLLFSVLFRVNGWVEGTGKHLKIVFKLIYKYNTGAILNSLTKFNRSC